MPYMSGNKRKGDYGETAAAGFLQTKGYILLSQNYKRGGEVDIIAKHNECIVFIEVKYRKSLAHGLPSDAVNIVKQRQIVNVAKKYIVENGLDGNDVRFDVIEVIGTEELEINHIEDAFWAT